MRFLFIVLVFLLDVLNTGVARQNCIVAPERQASPPHFSLRLRFCSSVQTFEPHSERERRTQPGLQYNTTVRHGRLYGQPGDGWADDEPGGCDVVILTSHGWEQQQPQQQQQQQQRPQQQHNLCHAG